MPWLPDKLKQKAKPVPTSSPYPDSSHDFGAPPPDVDSDPAETQPSWWKTAAKAAARTATGAYNGDHGGDWWKTSGGGLVDGFMHGGGNDTEWWK